MASLGLAELRTFFRKSTCFRDGAARERSDNGA